MAETSKLNNFDSAQKSKISDIEELKSKVYPYALKNAIEHDGKCQAGSVISSLFHEGLEKEQVKEIMPDINIQVKKVNSMKLDEQKAEFEKLSNQVTKREEKHGLPDLPNAKIGKVVTRIAPEPSKYNHLGHALSFLLNYIYAKKYKGKCLLRFEDTNPEKVSQEYVDAMKSDVLDYLDIKVSSTRYVSDDMPKLYKFAEKLIKINKAYMCFCSRDKMQKLRVEGQECACRQKPIKENLSQWKDFLKGKYMNGQATLRIKGAMQSDNYVMRDSVIFRAVKEKHYRKANKYKVWPMYDFYNPIEDSLMNITHILRSNEFEVRVELQDYIKDLLKLKKQEIIQYGRFNVIGATTQGREIRELVESGEYIGWDDPRLVTLRALKRRGIVKETFYELANNVGLTKHPVNLDFDMVAAINRKLVDKIADRYSFIPSPLKLKIDKIPVKEVEIKIHPDKQEKRKLQIKDIYISEKDYNSFLGNEVRLMHLFNVKLGKSEKATFTTIENKEIPKINWVSEIVPAKILMPDASWVSGFAESGIKNLKVNDILQFERFGFVRLDKINESGEYEFWFSHQ